MSNSKYFKPTILAKLSPTDRKRVLRYEKRHGVELTGKGVLKILEEFKYEQEEKRKYLRGNEPWRAGR